MVAHTFKTIAWSGGSQLPDFLATASACKPSSSASSSNRRPQCSPGHWTDRLSQAYENELEYGPFGSETALGKRTSLWSGGGNEPTKSRKHANVEQQFTEFQRAKANSSASHFQRFLPKPHRNHTTTDRDSGKRSHPTLTCSPSAFHSPSACENMKELSVDLYCDDLFEWAYLESLSKLSALGVADPLFVRTDTSSSLKTAAARLNMIKRHLLIVAT